MRSIVQPAYRLWLEGMCSGMVVCFRFPLALMWTAMRSATARDRDKLRQAALENLGWRILRIWSTEWWLDSTAALEKVHQRLLMILEADRASEGQHEVESKPEPGDAIDQPPSAPVRLGPEVSFPSDGDTRVEEISTAEPVVAEHGADQYEAERLYADLVRSAPGLKIDVPTYREADPSDAATPDHSRFYDPAYRPQLRKMIDHIVTIEGPIYFDTLVGRVARAHGFQRARGTIREIIRSSLGRGRFPQTQDDGQELIWPVGADASVLCPWRGPGPRHHNEIPLVELASLAKVFEAAGYDDETIIRTMQETFGLGRLKAPTRERFQRAVEKARQNA